MPVKFLATANIWPRIRWLLWSKFITKQPPRFVTGNPALPNLLYSSVMLNIFCVVCMCRCVLIFMKATILLSTHWEISFVFLIFFFSFFSFPLPYRRCTHNGLYNLVYTFGCYSCCVFLKIPQKSNARVTQLPLVFY